MPLDRRISVTYTTTPSGGSPMTTTLNVWGQKLQDNVARDLAPGGVRRAANRVYRVRFNQVLVTAIEGGETVEVIDNGLTQVVSGIGEPDRTRRRFLDLLISE